MFFYHRHHYLLDTVIVLALFSLYGCHRANQANRSQPQQSAITRQAEAPATSGNLAKLNYQSGHPAFITVNHDRSTLRASDWKRDGVSYANLDRENRTSRANVGTLDRKNVANDSLRVQQTVRPTGYHQKFINGAPVLNRGHEIAYSLSKGISASGHYNPRAKSGDQNNPKNLFTQTAFSNQEVQTIYEAKVRNALRQGKRVIYSVQPVFSGNDKMAKGVHMQALSTDGQLNYNVYLFNVQPGLAFNYANGTSRVDKAMKVPTPAGAPHFHDNNRGRQLGRFPRRGYYPHRHHFLRDYLIYRGAKSMWRHHEYNRMRRHGFGMMRRRPGLFRRHAYSRF